MGDSVALLMKQIDGQVALNLEIDGHSVFFPRAVLPITVTRVSFCADSKVRIFNTTLFDIFRVLAVGYFQML
jgi:hypothetical protein